MVKIKLYKKGRKELMPCQLITSTICFVLPEKMESEKVNSFCCFIVHLITKTVTTLTSTTIA